MISLFIKKNILESLTNTKFIIVSTIFLFFMIQGAIFFAIDYPVSLQNYRNLNKQAEDNVNLERAVIIKKPNKLAFIHGKEDDYLPKYLIVIPNFTDYPIEDVSLRSFLENSAHLDWMFIICNLFSLLAFIATFNMISEERERGTLKIIFSNSVKKSDFLLGNVFGAHLMLGSVFFLGLSANLLVLLVLCDPGFLLDDWTKILFVVGMTLVLTSTLVFIGMLASSLFAKSSTSMVFLLFVWFFMAILIPQGSPLLSKIISPTPSFKSFETELGSARALFYSKTQISNRELRSIYSDQKLTPLEKQNRAQALQAEKRRQHLEAFDGYISQIKKIREDYINKLQGQVKWMEWISRISPLALYENGVAGIIQAGRFHQKELYIKAQRYMAVYSKAVLKLRNDLIDNAEIIGGEIIDEGYSLKSIDWISFDNVAFDRSAVPKYDDQYENLGVRSIPALDVALLILLCLLLFYLCYIKLLVMDVR